ncbi:MAG TPA: MMPL family transporter [Micropepsaceae bacterium]|nr:MMPL family transporter [Micropepsaceae bacterium]
MWTSFERLVEVCCRHAWTVLAACFVFAVASGVYVTRNFQMDSNSENLISPDVPWRQNNIEFDRAFPQRSNLTVVVIDGVTAERTQEAASLLASGLRTRKDLFPVVRDIAGDPFFAHNGLLYSSVDEVRDTTGHIIAAQPFLAPLAADPSLRGIMDSLSTALLGIEKGQGKLEDLTPAFTAFSDTLQKTLSGQPAFLSWQSLITGKSPTIRETRHIFEVQTLMDYRKLAPGLPAANALREIARDLHLTPEEGVTVRLTGPVPLADEEFMTLTDRAALMSVLMISAILLMLWFAVRSLKIMTAILVTLFAGLAVTTTLGLLLIGQYNVISVAFIPLFVGIGVDFGIQYCVRYRAERHALGSLTRALVHAGRCMGPSLMLASFATAACFFSFVPTDYSGLAELGFVAGSGMLVAFLLCGTMLPAMLEVMKPEGEQTEVGFAKFAVLDRFLCGHKTAVLLLAALVALGGLALLPRLKFDANPLNLRNRQTESMATLIDLAKDPDTSPNTIDVLAPSRSAAQELKTKLESLAEVDHTMTIESFIPDHQPEKLMLISDAALLLDTTLDPLDMKPPPNTEEVRTSIATTAEKLHAVAMKEPNGGTETARRFADLLDALKAADDRTLALTTSAFVPGLKTILEQLRAALSPEMATLDKLPPDLKREWLTPDGRARIQIYPKGVPDENADLEPFADAVRTIAPKAVGSPIGTLESGRTIVRAFIQAGALSLLAMVFLLAIALRDVRDVLLTLLPLLLIGILTFSSVVLFRMKLNFANIIVLPLLFGIGVAFNIYFIMHWRAGGHAFLQSSLTRAVLLSAATTASGFGTLWLSRHPGTASMGALLTISLAWTLIVTLFFVPVLLECVWPRSRPTKDGAFP